MRWYGYGKLESYEVLTGCDSGVVAHGVTRLPKRSLIEEVGEVLVGEGWEVDFGGVETG